MIWIWSGRLTVYGVSSAAAHRVLDAELRENLQTAEEESRMCALRALPADSHVVYLIHTREHLSNSLGSKFAVVNHHLFFPFLRRVLRWVQKEWPAKRNLSFSKYINSVDLIFTSR
jgi:hypothetical protein